MSVYLWCGLAVLPVAALAFVLFLDEHIASRGWARLSTEHDRTRIEEIALEYALPYLDENGLVIWPELSQVREKPRQYRFPL